MSTRCVINFCYGKRVVAKVYRHHDGYPDTDGGVLADLTRFVTDVEKDTRDTRFNDPSYLAAKFVVWQADKLAVDYKFNKGQTEVISHGRKLDFLGVGVLMEDPGDIDYRYFVDCGNIENSKPVVAWEEVK